MKPLYALHLLIVATYVAAPITALILAIRAKTRQQHGPFVTLLTTSVAGFVVGLALCIVYAVASGGRIIATQIILAAYFATALLLLIKFLDATLQASLKRLLRLRDVNAAMSFTRGLRLMLASMLRVIILVAITLPYSMAAIMTYRPKVAPREDPQSLMNVQFERAEFHARDGTKIVGWFIPSIRSRAASRWEDSGKNTVIVCPGLAANKSNQLTMCHKLVPGGFNCLIIDFRAHGESGGQLTSYGDLERRDVLAAVKWVRENHPQQSRKIFGLGASMGAAALIAAAADDSNEGRAIEAIATYGCFDDLKNLATSIAHQRFAPPLDWLLIHVALPIASAHAGADLAHFAPEKVTEKLWPRPILFIHGMRDEIIDFDLAQDLFDRTPQPKFNYWLPVANHNDILEDETAARIVIEFFKTAQPMPVI